MSIAKAKYRLLVRVLLIAIYIGFFTVQCVYNFDVSNLSSIKISFSKKPDHQPYTQNLFVSKHKIAKKNIRLNKRFQPESFQITQPFVTDIPVINFVTSFPILTEEPVIKSVTYTALRGPPEFAV